jgi:hypothetical protein
MKEYVVFKIILFMLNSFANVSAKDLSHQSKCHLLDVAHYASSMTTNEHELKTILAIGFIESKFNFLGEKNIISRHGACGIYQQVPRYAKPLTCDDLHNTEIATKQVLSATNDIFQRHDFKLSKICEYNSGPRCNDHSNRYAKYFIFLYGEIHKILSEKNEEFKSFKIDEYEDLVEMCESGC